MQQMMAADVDHRYYVTTACLERSLDVVNGALVSHYFTVPRSHLLTFYSIILAMEIAWLYTPLIAPTVMSLETDQRYCTHFNPCVRMSKRYSRS